MGRRAWIVVVAGLVGVLASARDSRPAPAQDDLADVPSEDLLVGADKAKKKEGVKNQRYFLIGPRAEAAAPPEGFRLLVVLPGGDGGADFHPFVKRIFKHALEEKYLVAQPVAFRWTDDQAIVWPTETNKVTKQEFSTEAFVEAVVADVQRKHKLDPRYCFTLSWSSSGPAAYAISLQAKKSVTGSYVSMSVWKPETLPSLKSAAGHAYWIEHSRDDQICPFAMAEKARDALKKKGAKVEFSTYEGGHGWVGDVYGRIRRGVEWLEKHATAPAARR